MATANTQYIPETLPHSNTKIISYQVYKADGVTPMVLNDAWIILTVRENATDADPVLQLANAIAGGSDDEITVTSPTTGQFTVTIKPTDTLGLDPGLYTYSVDVFWVSGGDPLRPDEQYTIAYGPLSITEHA